MGHGFSYFKTYETCCQNDLVRANPAGYQFPRYIKFPGPIQVNHLIQWSWSFKPIEMRVGVMAAMKVLLTNLYSEPNWSVASVLPTGCSSQWWWAAGTQWWCAAGYFLQVQVFSNKQLWLKDFWVNLAGNFLKTTLWSKTFPTQPLSFHFSSTRSKLHCSLMAPQTSLSPLSLSVAIFPNKSLPLKLCLSVHYSQDLN